MLTAFKTILEVAKAIFRLADQLKAANRQRKQDMAAFFADISSCLQAVAAEIRLGNIPHGRCSELQTYADALPDLVRNEVGTAQADALGATLRSAYNVEGAAAEIAGATQGDAKARDQYIQPIDEAAGKFKALASILRVS
jgi:hypothetical protein